MDSSSRGGNFGQRDHFSRPPRPQLSQEEGKVDPPVRCAQVDADGNRCETMIDWLPFPFTKDRNPEGEAIETNREGEQVVRQVFCKPHNDERRANRPRFNDNRSGGFQPRFNDNHGGGFRNNFNN